MQEDWSKKNEHAWTLPLGHQGKSLWKSDEKPLGNISADELPEPIATV